MTREEAIRKLQKQKAEYLEEWVDFSGVAEAYDMAIEALEQPIIRCKDCKHWTTMVERPKHGTCDQWCTLNVTRRIEYCSRAERKES